MKWLAYQFWRLRGWTFVGALPDVPKMIIIGAPHTSNWDFTLYLAALRAYRIRTSFIGKHTLFRWPFGVLFRAWGGIPVDRSRPGGVVGQVTEAFDTSENMILVIAPEGTRSATSHWKSGFVKISEAANVPVVLAGVDLGSRRVVLGPSLDYLGDLAEFMDQVRAFYEDMSGLRPELKGPISLLEEQPS